MATFPAIFVSHGSPDMPLQTGPTLDFLQQLGTQLGKPTAILAVSAHWSTRQPTVSLADQARTIHDFGGFPRAVYQLNYPAPGAPALAQRVSTVLTQAGLEVNLHPDRGLDHGAWEPLLMMYPEADIPVTQLSLQPHLGPAHHLRIGQALAPLTREGVLILASGGATHNLYEFGGYDLYAQPPDWVTAFDEWLAGAIATGDTEGLLNYRQRAPFATRNHPTDEHLLPLFVALGAGGPAAQGTQLHQAYTYGILSMAAYQFEPTLVPGSL